MESTVFIDVDTQYSFMHKKGKFYVANSEKIVPNLRRITKFADERSIPVIATIDLHKEHDIELEVLNSSNNCLEIIKGSKKIKETVSENNVILEKSQHNPFSNTELDELIRGKKNAFVFGVATEFCIQATVLELLKRNIKTYVIEDAIMHVSQENGKKSINLMRETGAKFITTDMLLNS